MRIVNQEVSPKFFGGDNENIDPIAFDQMESAETKPESFDFDSAHPSGGKRARYTQPMVGDLLNPIGDWNSPSNSNEIKANGNHGTVQTGNKGETAKDESAIFADFVATEIRTLKTDHFRRKLKILFHKCLVEVMENEEKMLAQRNE